SLLLTFVRWYVLVRAQGLPFKLSDALRLGMAGFFFNSFLPGAVGGDILKAMFLAREQSRRAVAVATVVMDRVIGLWALVWIVALLGGAFWAGGLLPEGARQSSQVIIVASGVIVVLTLLVWALLGRLPAAGAERLAGRLERLPKVGGVAAEFWR